MNISSLDRLQNKLKRNTRLTPQTAIYLEGVKAKLRESYFSLQYIKELEHAEDSVSLSGTATTGGQQLLNTHEKVIFYCECLWDSLRSSLDILAQLVNDLHTLNIPEKDVDYKGVCKKIAAAQPNSVLARRMNGCMKSKAFKTLEKYRHCSTHRRQVYIEARKRTGGTAGYQYSGGSMSITDRYLCNNPGDLTPQVDYKTQVGAHSHLLLGKIKWHISTIVNAM